MLRVRALSGAIIAAVLVAGAVAASAQQWPTRPIRVVSPFPAGSASDTTARVVLDQLSQALGQPMVVEGRAGAGGTLGFADVAKADPDGYTIARPGQRQREGPAHPVHE